MLPGGKAPAPLPIDALSSGTLEKQDERNQGNTMKKILLASSLICASLATTAQAETRLADDIRGYSIHEMLLPTIRLAYSYMTPERQMALAECQVSTLERMLDTPEDVRSAISDLPMYIEWSEGLIREEPDVRFEHEVLNAYMQCQ